jgi:hypothetical protein
MRIHKKPVVQELRRGVVGETVISTNGPIEVAPGHAVIVGAPDDSWPVSFEYLLENTIPDPDDLEAKVFYDEMRQAIQQGVKEESAT